MERLVRSQKLRLSLASAIIAIGIWSFLPYLTHRVATSAYVNAVAPNRGHLVHLEQQLAVASSQIILGRAQLGEVCNAEKALTVRLQIYRKAALEGLKGSIQVAKSLWIGCLAE